jgi:hypothetical protein
MKLGVDERLILKWILKEIGCGQDRAQWQVLMKLCVL